MIIPQAEHQGRMIVELNVVDIHHSGGKAQITARKQGY